MSRIPVNSRIAVNKSSPAKWVSIAATKFVRSILNRTALMTVMELDLWANPMRIEHRVMPQARQANVIASYSHGMKQRTAIIAALIHQPRLLVLDEPFVGLDPKGAWHLKQIMQGLTRDGGAIFFSTHVLDVAEKLCNKIAIIKSGKLVVSGDTERVRGDHSLESVFLEVQEHE